MIECEIKQDLNIVFLGAVSARSVLKCVWLIGCPGRFIGCCYVHARDVTATIYNENIDRLCR